MSEMLAPNTPAPDFSLPDADGNSVALSDYRGRNVVLAFYPHDWSNVCSSQLSLYQELLDNIHEYNAEVLAVSVDSQDSHRAWRDQMHITFPLLSDFWPHGAVAQQYGAFREQNGFAERALFFVDAEGMIRDTWIGEHPGIAPGLDIVFNALKRLQAESHE